MAAVYRTALVKLRALVGGGAELMAEDIVRTSMKAGGRCPIRAAGPSSRRG